MQREGMIGFAALLTVAVLATGDGRPNDEGAAALKAQETTMISDPSAAAPELRRTSPGNASAEDANGQGQGEPVTQRLRFHVSVSL